MSVKQARQLVVNTFGEDNCTTRFLDNFPGSLAVTIYVANALCEAVRNHVQEAAAAATAAGQPYAMPDTSDPVVVCNTLFDFLGEGFGKDSLQLVVLPADVESDHPLVVPGKPQEVCPNFIKNAMALLLRVPSVPVYNSEGKIRKIRFHPDYFFRDRAGMERWLRIRADRNPRGELFLMKV